jgi:3',5'-cyclic AMP phosphodiesterase CpdA
MGENQEAVRFGITSDAHLLGGMRPDAHVANLNGFLREMERWRPDFIMDMGDFACQRGPGPTTQELHDSQLQGLREAWDTYTGAGLPAYIAMGNHDVGWVSGEDEVIGPGDLYAAGEGHGGEDITKGEWLEVTGMPGRYYSFEVKGARFIVLDGHSARPEASTDVGHDGVEGAYWIDDAQMDWVARELEAHREAVKVVFCHEELHHTPLAGSGQGGSVPFPSVGKERSYVDNGWELRRLFEADGKVAAAFAAHKHRSRWTVYGGVHYLTLAALHWRESLAKVTLSDRLVIEGAGGQWGFDLPLA